MDNLSEMLTTHGRTHARTDAGRRAIPIAHHEHFVLRWVKNWKEPFSNYSCEMEVKFVDSLNFKDFFYKFYYDALWDFWPGGI